MKMRHGSLARTAVAVLGFICVLAGLSATAFAHPEFPELDPGSMANALLVLSGGFLIVTGRRPRK